MRLQSSNVECHAWTRSLQNLRDCGAVPAGSNRSEQAHWRLPRLCWGVWAQRRCWPLRRPRPPGYACEGCWRRVTGPCCRHCASTSPPQPMPLQACCSDRLAAGPLSRPDGPRSPTKLHSTHVYPLPQINAPVPQYAKLPLGCMTESKVRETAGM